MADDNRTQMMGAAPTADPNKTIMGAAPSLNTTVTIKPVQCPVCKSFNPPGTMFCNECGLIFEKALDGDAFGAPAIQLPSIVDATGREHQLRPGENTVGRQGDVLIEDTRVSRRHASFLLEGQTVKVKDLGSTNGTKVGGSPIGQDYVDVANGAVVSLGGYEVRVSAPGEQNKTQVALSGKTVGLTVAPTVNSAVAWLVLDEGEQALEPGTHTFGRRTDNDIVIPDPYVSGRHGKFDVDDTGVYLTDTGSTNGTVLNDAKIAANQRTQLRKGDVIRLGEREIRLRFKE